jgi:hypothetical protein
LYLFPVKIDYAGSFTKIGVNSITAVSSDNARLGIYSNNNGVPGTLLLDAGAISLTATGDREITISQSLSPGWYWLAMVADQTTSVCADDSDLLSRFLPPEGVGGVANSPLYYYYAHTYGALPTSHSAFVAQSGSVNVPRVWLRVA